MLVSELQNLLRLTAFEQTIATVRRTQARTAALEEELAANVEKARERSALLVSAIRQVGGVPDVVGSAVGKLGAFTTAQVNQVQTLQGALLGDLTLEHQLRERARYARGLAVSLGESSLLPVFDRLETAHTATIDWLETRLAEVGRTGTSLLRATPLQVVVGSARRVALAPLGVVTGTVNQVSALLWRRTPEQVQDALSAAVSAADSALDAGVSAARTAVQRTEDTAQAAGAGASAAVAQATDTVRTRVDEAEALAGDAVHTVTDAVHTVNDVVTDAAGTVAETAVAATSTVTDAASDVAETVHEAASDVAETATETVAELAEEAKEAAADLEVVDLTGTGEVAHPFAGYEKLSGDRVMGHVRDTEDVTELEQILAFETANKARKGVLAAVQQRLEALSTSA
jgi:bacterioferritin (cytochrome b1)